MATVEPARTHDRHTRRRPFAGWMKRLANLKNSSSDSPAADKKGHGLSPSKGKKAAKNNPYPESARLSQLQNYGPANDRFSVSSPVSNAHGSFSSLDETDGTYTRRTAARSTKSTAPTVMTNPGTVNSEAAQSKAGTSHTVSGGMSSLEGGNNSTFSSPNQSVRSLTTTATTVQSTAPSAMLGQAAAAQPHQVQPPVHFSHQFPTSPPASAIPPHLSPQPNVGSYHAATANNLLTDNASILTLASSSKRRRRHSLDTNASVRALAPSSLWGGSRESLPLSVLSANIETGNPGPSGSVYPTPTRPSMSGLVGPDRVSVYSSSGVAAPALSSDRNSYYATKQGVDGASIRSGLLGHGRTDSISGSIGPGATGSLASPREPTTPARLGRRSLEWKEDRGETSEDDNQEEDAKKIAGKEQSKFA